MEMKSSSHPSSGEHQLRQDQQQSQAAARGVGSLDNLFDSLLAAIQRIALPFLRYALALVLLWIALLKFHDPHPVAGLIAASFLFRFLASSGFVYLLGVLEIIGAILLIANVGVRYVGLGVALLFVGTLSIFLTAPAVAYTPGFPFLSLAGQFLLKDVALLAGALVLVASDVSARSQASR